jgi:nitrile hydratase accessory protein
MTVDATITATTGVAALPRSNGELVFEEPWQARAFGIAVGLVQAQGLDWEVFRGRLIDEIRSEGADEPSEPWSYYERWLAALERMVVELAMVSRAEIDARAARIAHEMEHEHDDHRHGHDRAGTR